MLEHRQFRKPYAASRGHLGYLVAVLAGLMALAACAGPVTPEPPVTINVAGSVQALGGEPLASAEVFLEDAGGLRGPVASAVDGGFDFADVAAPYSLSVVPPPGSLLTPVTWANLTRPNPKVVLTMETGGAPTENCPSGKGRVAGFINPPVGPANTAEVFFISDALSVQGVSFASVSRPSGAATYEILPTFNGIECPAGAIGKLVYVERDAVGDIAGVAVVDGVFVANDDTVSTAENLSPGPFVAGVISGTISFPAGVDEAEVQPVMRFGDAYALMEGTTVSAAAPDFSLQVPVVAGIQFRVLASRLAAPANLRWSWSDVVSAPANDIVIDLGDLSEMTSPSGATTDPSPSFDYTAVAGINLYSVMIIDGNAFAHMAMSDQEQLSIPQLPPAAQLSGDLAWAVVGITARDADSVDDLLDGRLVEGLYLSTDAMDEPDKVRSGFANADFMNFSLP